MVTGSLWGRSSRKNDPMKATHRPPSSTNAATTRAEVGEFGEPSTNVVLGTAIAASAAGPGTARMELRVALTKPTD